MQAQVSGISVQTSNRDLFFVFSSCSGEARRTTLREGRECAELHDGLSVL